MEVDAEKSVLIAKKFIELVKEMRLEAHIEGPIEIKFATSSALTATLVRQSREIMTKTDCLRLLHEKLENPAGELVRGFEIFNNFVMIAISKANKEEVL